MIRKRTISRYRRLAALVVVMLMGILVLSGCESVATRADHQDTWQHIKRRGTVVIGVDDSFVPMGFREKNGKLVGYDVDLAKATFAQYGLKVDFQTIDWSMKETELRNGTIDAIWNGYTITPQRAAKVAFSRPYLRNRQVLVTKRKQNIRRFSDMKGKILGLQTGSSAQTLVNQKPKLLKQYIKGSPITYDTFNDAFIDLNVNRIQGLLIDQVYAGYYVKHEPNPSAYRTIVGDFAGEDYAVGLRKGDVTLRKKINQAFVKLAKNGQLSQINHKWFGQDSDSLISK
ncbi:amino acid ABC transporter substrate-binding protein [Furfurilactobacillus rossiae]|uniref:Glutamine ABC transporter substrate-binding protein n=1 Tax=Furfurilactobacillus rossiae DSM 15814 TaxID=1114972 RepID=A0A0R1RBE3_9LACO|nr:amino acid ABC transporter substrate-binding protein [Furfurilactobacillus rossiae]KRL54182.1 glutamine ABC transporter substrate-binding protein [Furfurilactobacillus rossiae DSM 15814]MCF6166505.1 amino acid ABC transporter substrate-binding protein [Furfurilactobacillus rossiae]QFR66336.1 transporter substrate-binding domain-containing protein [Furfurilactobacillus rossiae]QLE61788.1 amino acid ABC transporter amino acid-binding protein [Furfurilactobacillus rossiae]QLE64588.1 amino acid